MNKLQSIFLSILFLLFFSCSQNSDDSPEPEQEIDKTANLQGTGDSANDILSNASFDKIKIEIAHVTGFRPTAAAMTEFTDFLRQHTFKEDIEVIFTQLDSPEEDSLTLQEIAELEGENRTVYNSGRTLGIYIYFADAPSVGDEEDGGRVTLGAVYRNTSMIIHEVTVRRLAAQSSFISNADVESATLNHEFGHLFGLVNLGTRAINDHEDPDALNHCNVPGCLMRAELQFGGSSGKSNLLASTSSYEDGVKAGCILSGQSVLNLLQSNSGKSSAAPGLDAECILDIQANGGR
ncbi:hypothetical protein BFP77_07420 [Maribacter sp. 4U21]|uniref:hypothetical protein n=1 Tax=Maribacter sp. 4U21 TaxID=1889779 RepID=UPI000C14D05D|nr:hypothetical protein [Maribacter sp. 4U21]PIB29024.1 hypothetical protein BFP77_07420 [Maribacter sp. 4U21]